MSEKNYYKLYVDGKEIGTISEKEKKKYMKLKGVVLKLIKKFD